MNVTTTAVGGSSHFIARGVCKGECSDGNETNEQDMETCSSVCNNETCSDSGDSCTGRTGAKHAETALGNQQEKRP